MDGLFLHPTEEGIVVFVHAAAAARVGLAVVLLVGEVVVVHVDVLGLVVAVAVAHAALLRRYHGVTREGPRVVEVHELRRQWRDRRNVRRQVHSTRLWCAIRAAQQTHGRRHVLVRIAVVRVRACHRGAGGGGSVRHIAPVAVVAVAVVREDGGLVGLAVGGAVGRVALDGALAKVRVRAVAAHSMVVHVRGRGSFCGAHTVTQVRRAGGWGRGRVVAVVALLVHGDEDRGGLEQLDLLVLGDEQLGGVLPFRSVFPTKSKVNAVHERNRTCLSACRAFVLSGESMWADSGRLRGTDRCLVRQLLCLYPFPHFSHLNSLPLVRLPSPLARREAPSLARRTRDFALPFSLSGSEANAGPSVTASLLAAL